MNQQNHKLNAIDAMANFGSTDWKITYNGEEVIKLKELNTEPGYMGYSNFEVKTISESFITEPEKKLFLISPKGK